jgi:hypothetical protein
MNKWTILLKIMKKRKFSLKTKVIVLFIKKKDLNLKK